MESTSKTGFPASSVLINRVSEEIGGHMVPIKVIETGEEGTRLYMIVTPLPKEPFLLQPKKGKEWAAIDTASSNTPDPDSGGNYLNRYKITGGDDLTVIGDRGPIDTRGKLYYEIFRGDPPSVGNHIAIYNIFYSPWHFHPHSLIKADYNEDWRKTYVAPGSGFLRSNGEYVLLVNGYNGKRHQVGAFKTRDFKQWEEAVATNPVFPPTQEVNASVYTTGNIFKLDGDRFIAYLTWIEGTVQRIGWVTFDENFTDIKYSAKEKGMVTFEDAMAPPKGCATPATIYRDGHYRMMFSWLGPTEIEWQTWEALATDPKGPFETHVLQNPAFITTTDDRYSYRSLGCDAYGYLEWKDKLYVLVGGTSRWDASGSKAKREYGCFCLEETSSPEWVPYPHPTNPMLINPLYANKKLWGSEYGWASDHIGGSPVFHRDEATKTLYLFISACEAKDTYKVACATMPYGIEKIEEIVAPIRRV